METAIVVLSKDSSIVRELSRSFPPGLKVRTAVSGAKNACVIVDIDTMGVALTRELGDSHVVIAVTRIVDTDVVIEATSAGAYEVITWPLDRNKVSSKLQELAGCIDAWSEKRPIESAPSRLRGLLRTISRFRTSRSTRTGSS